MTRTVLIVDDDPVQCRLLEAHVARMGAAPVVVTGGRAAIAFMDSEDGRAVSVVVLDLMMPDCGGLDVLAAFRQHGVDVPVVVQTAKAGIETVVEAMRAGAYDFIVKPASPEKLKGAIEGAVRAKRGASAEGDGAVLRRRLAAAFASEAMRPVLHASARAAASAIPVLIEGETGAGKEWLARAICADGPRARAPFVTVNCGALPKALAESILFGHEKGAFTDATLKRAGKFVEADGGTLFLDEVGELEPDVQVKLLRALQEGEIDPLGGRAPVRTDVRIIAATNRDLAADVRSGRFREDLFYRLNVFPIRVPPLRERRFEIPRLAERLLRRLAASDPGLAGRHLSAGAVRALQARDWPGNIRELENTLHRALVLSAREELTEADVLPAGNHAPNKAAGREGAGPLPVAATGFSQGASAATGGVPAAASGHLPMLGSDGHVRTVEAVEADLIAFALEHYGGRLSAVARHVGIGRSTLYRKLRQYGLSVEGAVSS